jgi:hypothetical protein
VKKYSVIVEGKNIYLNRGRIERMGFFTTRWVEATDRNEAEKKAIDLVKQEVEELDVLCNSPKDPPTFLVDKVREVDSFGDARVPGKGFALFPDELNKNA